MGTRRFFSTHGVVNDVVRVSGDELFHLRNVNRARVGDPVQVIDGAGTLVIGKIRSINEKEAVVAVEECVKEPPPALKIVVAPSLVKKRAMNLMIEKLSEIGVDEIRPVIFEHTDEKYTPSMLTKWQRITAQSLKVNKKLWMTRIYPPVSPAEIAPLAHSVQSRLALDTRGEPLVPAAVPLPALVVVGPPGDFTGEEIGLFDHNGFGRIRVNPCTLKSETAAISIAAILAAAGGLSKKG